MRSGRSLRWKAIASVVCLAVGVAPVAAQPSAAARAVQLPLTRISSDPYTNPDAQHRTQVEPDSFSFGSTIVMGVQTGRFPGGASTNIGWATSTDAGRTWTSGFLPHITAAGQPPGPWRAASDPVVAYSARHRVWMISVLALGGPGSAILTSRSTDGGLTWQRPAVTVSAPGVDKNWLVCDNTPTSPHYGNCYTQWSQPIRMSTSTDGGVTWTAPASPPGNPSGIGGQPLVRPNGTVVVPVPAGGRIASFRSTNGGASWRRLVTVATVQARPVTGMRASALPSAEIDATGRVYVAWQDCRFRTGCTANDIVYSTSTTGTAWSAPVRIPITPTSSTVNHFTPGIAVDATTSGATTRVAVAYYYMPPSGQVHAGYISSANAGATWSTAVELAGPMQLSWIADSTGRGRMLADYISTSITAGRAFPALVVATAPTGGMFNQDLYTAAGGLPVGAGRTRPQA